MRHPVEGELQAAAGTAGTAGASEQILVVIEGVGGAAYGAVVVAFGCVADGEVLAAAGAAYVVGR